MTDPLGGQSAAPGTGQSAGTVDQGTGTATNADGQSAVTPPAATTPDAGQSAVSREEFERLRLQLQTADKKRQEAEAAHAQLRDKDMPELQKMQRDLADATEAQRVMMEANTALRVENAFLSANEHEWHDPTAALKLLDRSRITVDADGNVQGMKEALKALAQANSWLIKPKAPEPPPGAPAAPPPGTAPANGGIGAQQGTTPTKAAMAARFPPMKQRM
jgi:hypothetical protein